MARRKDILEQVDFSLGSPRPEAVERGDTPLVEHGVKMAQNTIGLTTGAMEIRPGTVHILETQASTGIECDLGSGRVYDLHIIPSGLILYDADGATVASFTSHTWTAVSGFWGAPVFDDIRFWVVSDPDSSSIIIGSKHFPIHALVVDDAGVWTFGLMSFATSLAGAVRQPYWSYNRGVTITPSARTGAITMTASSGIWQAAHSGMRIRFLEREIVLGALVSSTVINAVVTEELPPTYDFTVASVSGYQVGEAVEHDALGGQGIITAISGSIITVLATELWDGFAASGNLVGPKAKQAISVMTTVSPAGSQLWDMQMQSPIHGYAGWGAKHKGRAYLCDFPGAPQAFAVSSAGFIDDFTLGELDGDGFVETLGANTGGDLKFILSAEDLLFFTTRGLYYQQTRDGSPITPRTIGPVPFSKLGCAGVYPVAVDDGAVFVDSVGSEVYAAVLSGNVYRSWKAANISKYHSHLISSPTRIGATQSGSEHPEDFIYVVNEDGTAAVCQWDRDESKIGWRSWSTDGAFKSIYQAFGKIHAVVGRTINGASKVFLERFETGIYMDCVASLAVSSSFPAGQVGVDYFAGVTKAATHLSGHTGTGYFEGWDIGDRTINASGAPLDEDGNLIVYPSYEGILQIGLKFDVRIIPWPRRSVKTSRGKRAVKRTTKILLSVQDTLSFTFDGRTFGGYRAGEDLSIPPPVRSEEAGFITGGRHHFEEREINVPRPGPFRLLKIKSRVTV